MVDDMWQQHWRWKWNRILSRWREKLAHWKELWRGAQSTTRMCHSCRALVSVKESECPFCGARLKRRPSGTGRFLQSVLPEYAPVSYTLLILNSIFYFLMLLVDWNPESGNLGQILLGGGNQSLLAWGADAGWLVSQGQWWRLISAIFIHIGLIHLFFNSYALMFIGPLLEDILGRERFLVVYIGTGVIGFWLSNLFHHPFIPTAGASGALFGLIGLALVLSRRYTIWGSLFHQQLKHWAIYGFVYGLLLRANNLAHLGGFLAGIGFAFLLGNPATFAQKESRLWKAIYWLFLLVTFYALFRAFYFRLISLKVGPS
jgi:rhomboid protease GluP